jgi:hypothetical protein
MMTVWQNIVLPGLIISTYFKTLLHASYPIPNDVCPVWTFGPDIYMVQNLVPLLEVMLEAPDWTHDKIGIRIIPKPLFHSKIPDLVAPSNMLVSQVVQAVDRSFRHRPKIYIDNIFGSGRSHVLTFYLP